MHLLLQVTVMKSNILLTPPPLNLQPQGGDRQTAEEKEGSSDTRESAI